MRENYNRQLSSFARQCRRDVNNYTERLNRNINKLKKIEYDGDEEEIQKLKYDIKADKESLFSSLRELNSIRKPFLEDIEERNNLDNFVEEVRNIIPNGVPIVFHGCGRIDTVEDIIQSGGLYTQKDRGYDVSATSPYICVCTKNDIHIASDYANGKYCVPYGALFVLAPKDEYEKKQFLNVDAYIAAGNLTFTTTTSLNFHDEPDRLVAIITTSENLDRLKEVARENELNEDLIVTHNEFIQRCKRKYEKNKNVSL